MEFTQLHEYLECSVCFEQLNEASRVLPCQHTFCLRCLDNIVSQGPNCRCPECRTEFKGSSVRNLPRNVLLLRILDGMKQEKSSLKIAAADSKESKKAPLSPVQKHQPGPRDIEQFLPHGRAIFSFNAVESDDASFGAGDIVYLLQKACNNWYEGLVDGTRGCIPANYIEVIKPLPSFEDPSEDAAFARALYNFEDPSEEVLSFNEGDLIYFTKKVPGDSNWGEGYLGNHHGIFPFNYVELNSAASELLSTSSSSEEDDVADGSDQPASTLSPWVKLEAAPKRHTIHVENPDERATAKMLLSSAANQNGGSHSGSEARRGSSSQLEVSSSYVHVSNDSLESAARPATRPAPMPAASSRGSSKGKESNSNEMHGALYDYAPNNDDELALVKGRMYKIVTSYEDGWVKGTDTQTSKTGMFPANYVKVVLNVSNVSRTRSGSEPSDPSPSSVLERNKRVIRIAKKKAPKRPAPTAPPPYSAAPTATSSSLLAHRQPKPLPSLPHEPPPPYSPRHPNPTVAVGSSQLTQKERCRVIADYPPTENYELELRVGDIVVVKKKSSDGWYKGTCLRNGRTGLFPSSFVELMTR